MNSTSTSVLPFWLLKKGTEGQQGLGLHKCPWRRRRRLMQNYNDFCACDNRAACRAQTSVRKGFRHICRICRNIRVRFVAAGAKPARTSPTWEARCTLTVFRAAFQSTSSIGKAVVTIEIARVDRTPARQQAP